MTMELLISGAQILGINLNKEQVDKFRLYYDVLIEWNRKFNLTAITDYNDVQLKHFLDSLTITLVWMPTDKDFVLDIGSGAGFPALPLKIVFPGFRLVLLEATGKKAAFLSHVTSELGMDGVEIIHGRAEELAHNTAYREKFDVVLARAVAELPSLVELSLPFCKPGGIVVSPKKNDISPELQEAKKAIVLLGGKMREPVKVEIPGLGDERCLVVIDKIMETPLSFPRRSGIPQKRPIK